jgi:hypothetical protein
MQADPLKTGASMNRRRWFARLGVACLGGVCLAAGRAAADEPISLQSTLEKGLYCRRPVEFEFVGLVAHKVEVGKLPRRVVLSMFKWARERRPDLPFPYFQAGIRERAKALNVEL